MTTFHDDFQITVTAPIGDLEAFERALVAARRSECRSSGRVALTAPVAVLEELDACLAEYRHYRARIVAADEAGNEAELRRLEENEVYQLDRIADAVAAFLESHRRR